MKNKSIFLIPLAIIAFVIYGAAYSVDETEQVVITQFGRIAVSYTHLTLPTTKALCRSRWWACH